MEITPHELAIRLIDAFLIALNVAAWIVTDLQAARHRKYDPPILASSDMPKVNWYTDNGGNDGQ